MSEKASNDDGIDVIDLLEAASGSTMDFLTNHNFSTTVREQLQGKNPTPCLLELASFFRAQSALLIRQAIALEEIASYEEGASNAMETIDDVMHRSNVSSLVGKVHEKQENTVDRLDAIEDCLVPLKEVNESNKLVKHAHRVISPYTAFVQDTYKSLVPPPGVPRRGMANVGKATSAIWKNMSEEKRQVYREKAARMTREREEEVAAARASKRVKVNESDNEESESDTSESSE